MDISNNPIEYQDFSKFKNLKHLEIDPQRDVSHFRKKFLTINESLVWFNGRAVTPDERRLLRAWNEGGMEAEKLERQTMRDEQK